MSQKPRFQPRNDYVLIRRVKHRVSAFGPDVKGLEVGDSVLILGSVGREYVFLPNSRDLLITKQESVVMVYG